MGVIFGETLWEFWHWLLERQWQLYGVAFLAILFWIVRRYSLATLIVVVAGFAWFVGFVVSRTDMGAGFGTNALNFAMLGAAALAATMAWFFLIRKP